MVLTRVGIASVLLVVTAMVPLLAVAQLSGTYTIGGTAPSYPSFGAAVSALAASGVNGAVTFNVRPGTYTEHIRIAPVIGASGTNTITFQSESGNPASVTLTYAAASVDSNYVVLVDGGDYLRFRTMTVTSGGLNTTYRNVFVFRGVSTDVTIQGNVITGYPAAATAPSLALVYQASNAQNVDLKVLNNTMSAGSFGVYMTGNSSSYSSGTILRGNTINSPAGYQGIYLTYNVGPVIDSNTVIVPNDAVSLLYCTSVSGSETIRITRNRIVTSAGGSGVFLNSCNGNVLYSTLVANNFVTLTGSSANYGIYLTGSGYVNVYHNSVLNAVPSTSGIALYVPGGNNIRLASNVFANTGGGYVYYVNTPSAITSSNRNNLFGNGNHFAYYSSSYIGTFEQLRAASGWEANSTNADPVFTSSTDLHSNSPWLDGAGQAVPEVTTDIDGQPRSGTTPDIGADEFTSSLTKMAGGTYTVGGSSPSYATLVAAVSDLNTRGILGPVTFNVRPGTYDGQVSIGTVGGAGPTNTVTIQSENGSAPSTVIRFSQTDVTPNYVVRLSATNNVRFNNLTIVSFGLNATYRTAVNFVGYNSNITFTGDSLVGGTTTGGTVSLAVVRADGAVLDGVTFDRNRIISGSYGLYLEGVSTLNSRNTVVSRNVVSNAAGYNGVSMTYCIAPVIDSNTVTTRNDAVYLLYCSNPSGAGQLAVTRNRIVTVGGGYGIFLNSCIGNILYSGLVANNFVTITGSNYNYGIYLSGTNYLNVYYNSVLVNVPSVSGIALYVPSGNNIRLANNVFANTGGGYVYYVNTPSGIASSDRNNLYGNGTFIGYIGSSYITDLPALRVATGWETNSPNANPNFTSATDLHATSPWMDGAATPVLEVTTDIDGQPRSGTTPDIGADEFTGSLTKMAAGNYTVGGASPNYATPAAAVSDLNTRGIQGPVTFTIRPGTYDGQLTLGPIGGSSATNTATFLSESGTPANTTIRFSQTDVTPNHVLRLDAAANVRFQNLTFVSFGLNANNRVVVRLSGYVNNASFVGDSLLGAATTNSAAALAVVAGTNVVLNDVTFDRSRFYAGSYGVYIDGVSTVYSRRTTIRRSTLNNSAGYAGIYLTYQIGPVIDSNSVVSRNDALYLLYCSNTLGEDQVKITHNTLVTNAGGTGIFMNSCNGNSLYSSLVANNTVAITGASYNYGLYFSGSTYVNMFNNSVSVTVPSTNGVALYVPSGGNLRAVNNLFVNTGGGYAYYVNQPAALTWLNWNNLYTTGTNLAYWGNQNVPDLPALRTLSGRDSNSVSRPVSFVSSSNLHLAGASVGDRSLRCLPLAEVPRDIDGDLRNPVNPYMGADEASVPLAVGGGGDDGGTKGGGIEEAPLEYQLMQNYPNPFNPETVIKFSVRQTGRARIDVYNAIGQLVANVFDGTAEAGQYYTARLSGIGLPSGMYFYRLQSGTWTDQKKMLLVK